MFLKSMTSLVQALEVLEAVNAYIGCGSASGGSENA